MKRNIYRFIVAVCAIAGSYSSWAQNLDPTVEVNRTYEGKLMEVHKPEMEMAVPDSALRFDLDFDYSVFENPYKGAYEFKPYSMTLKPVAAPKERKSLYLNMGSGVFFTGGVMPSADFVWSPLSSGDFRLDVYASHDSYIGEYQIPVDYDPAKDKVLFGGMKDMDGNKRNRDFMSRAGVAGSYDWAAGQAKAAVGYYGIYEKFDSRSNLFSALDASASVSSKDYGQMFKYAVDMSYRFSGDDLDVSDENNKLKGHEVSFNGRLLGDVMDGHAIVFDMGMDLVSYSGFINDGVTRLSFAPKYLLELDRLRLAAGFKMGFLVPSGSDSLCFRSETGLKNNFPMYPDIRADFQLVPDYMNAYAAITGGTRVNTYSTLIDSNHHINLFSAFGGPLMDNTIERLSTYAGLQGRAGTGFTYDVRAGYSGYRNALVDKVMILDNKFIPGIAYADYRKFFAAAEWGLKKDRFTFDGSVSYSHMWFMDKNAAEGLFLPPGLEGTVSFDYNWKERVYLGAHCDFAAIRKPGTVLRPDATSLIKARVPGYADLGVDFEYLVTRKFSFWAEIGNLLGSFMPVQHNLLYGISGPYLAAGICLNL